MGQPLEYNPEALTAHAEGADAFASELEGVNAFDPLEFQGLMLAGLGPIGAPFIASFLAAVANHKTTNEEVVAGLRAHAESTRESLAQYEGTDAAHAAELEADTFEEAADQLESGELKANQLAGFKDKFPFKESPDPPVGMPPPPPEPPVPHDAAAYNSETNPWDKVAAGANKAEGAGVVEYFHARGWDLSAQMLDHYLENTGEDFTMPASAMHTIVNDPQITPALGEQMGTVVDKAVTNAKNNPALYGVPQAIATPYRSGVIAQDTDITYADAHFSVSTSALVTVNPPDESGQITYSAESQTHMYDYYYFHQTEEAQWDVVHAAMQSVDDDMRMLESEGWAKSFRVHGTSQVTTTTGTYDG